MFRDLEGNTDLESLPRDAFDEGFVDLLDVVDTNVECVPPYHWCVSGGLDQSEGDLDICPYVSILPL